MIWSRLISDKRLGMEEYHDPQRHTRSDFQRDYDRLVFSSPFRRMQNKTQVFPLPGSIFVHNRLTHSLEVSSVGRSMANEAAELLRARHKGEEWTACLDNLGDITATACLSHDLGNPPFGHSGEKTIQTFFTEGPGIILKDKLTEAQWADCSHFEGNANSFRLLSHQFVGRRPGGFAMTYSTLAAIVKYPHSSIYAGKKGKFGFFESEREIYERVATELGIPQLSPGRYARHPIVWLMEAADDICYQIMDIEDAHRLKILSTEEVQRLFLSFFDEKTATRRLESTMKLEDPNEQIGYLRARVIGELVGGCAKVFADKEEQILDGNFTGSLVSHCPDQLASAYENCAKTAWKKIYCAQDVVDIEIAGTHIISYLMEKLMNAVMNPDRNMSKLLLAKVPQQYDVSSPDLYVRVQSVLDHVSGMTDVYALGLYRQLNGHSLPNV